MTPVDIQLKQIDEVWCKIICNQGILRELSDELTFEVPGAKFMPQYKKRIWDGKIRLIKRDKIYIGLADYVKKYASDHSYSFASDFQLSHKPEKLSFNKWYLKNELIEPAEHQMKALYIAASHNRRLFLSPTGSGKSLIIYTIARELLSKVDEKIVILVPTTSLVDQLYGDFEEYSNHASHFMTNVTRVYHGMPREDKQIIISTWQSMMTIAPSIKIGAVLGDECHIYKGKEISKLLESMKRASYRYGFTGTLDGAEANRLILEGLFGPVFKVATTMELVSENKLSTFDIECVVLKYPKQDRAKRQYNEEIEFLLQHSARSKVIFDLADQSEGHTLLLFSRVAQQGEILYEALSKYSKKKVRYVYGGTPTEEREKIRKEVEDSKEDIIIVASSQVFSTGINIPSLTNIIFAYPSKSRIRTLQSIGRALRLRKGKKKAKIYDIADHLMKTNEDPNHTWKHFLERLKIYNQEDFDYEVTTIELEKHYAGLC